MQILTRKVIAGVGACVLALLVMEGISRVAHTVRPDLRGFLKQTHTSSWFRYSPVVGWERRPGFKGAVDNDYREFDAEGFPLSDSARPSHSSGPTVMFVGDSRTFGYGVRAQDTFAEVIKQLLPGVATVNLGVNGYTSYQGLKTLEKHLPSIRPAAVVASFSFNDRRAVPKGRQDGPAHFRNVYESAGSVIGRIHDTFGHLYLYRGMRVAMLRMGLLAGDTPLSELRPRVDETDYRHNLTKMAAHARRAGVPLILMVLPDNPITSGHATRGVKKLESSQYQAAIENFSWVASNKMTAYQDLGRLYLARAYRAIGKDREADETLAEGGKFLSLHGGNVLRFDWQYSAIMREVAAEQAVPIVDAVSVLESDPLVFIDDCHFDSSGHGKVAELLAPELANILGHGSRVPAFAPSVTHTTLR